MTKEAARAAAFAVTELMKEQGVIVFPNGVYDNVLKIKPPMNSSAITWTCTARRST